MLLFLCYLLLQTERLFIFQSGGLCQSLSSPRFLLSSAFWTNSGIPLSRLIPSFTACNPAYASAVNGSSMLE
ncbi:hypothetical protein ES319_D02G128900v1 [Gossypium barbadense]|uniref:Uncharacterized protein n=3 Tax=Gossypium TaxID=3633 RepID=A0A5J5RUC3_GOSBA|nr:hypothetical protein ES319_D04G017000v1 [Gossypium barbadense]KAB2041156.1 hypothetical protein ES319_D02G128900v1 [Gossypium barbadense]TYG72412.1 hypothetical protein ES288_D04G018700v1 [Gossypium darwinii]TYG79421.1 hypothetical protein ES288_D02G136900v1 [Gossypium darwinii]TYH75450.1 hypothetical protein ES332_D04G019800v1 [Gossypium tomentosum]